MISYSQRLNQFTQPCTWELHEKGLIWTREDGFQNRIPFKNIKSVRLRYEPTRAETRRYALRIHDGREHVITNIHYKGIMDFENRSETFNAFVDAFHQALRKANPGVKYMAGSTPAAFVGNLLVSLFVLVVLAFIAFFLFTSGMYGIVLVKAAIILFYVPVMLIQLKKNIPKSYDPAAIPTELMPA